MIIGCGKARQSEGEIHSQPFCPNPVAASLAKKLSRICPFAPVGRVPLPFLVKMSALECARLLKRFNMLALTAGVLYTPAQAVPRPLVLVEGGKISAIASLDHREIPANAKLLDFGPEAALVPGFLDLHIHGGAGYDVMENNPQGLAAMEKLLARHGVTSYYPTTVTAPMDTTLHALERLADEIEGGGRESGVRARPLGIHLEGPFISHLRRGVHPAENLLPAKVETFQRFWQAARGHIKIMTIAPEIEGALDLIAFAAESGVCVSLGHSDADLATTRKAVLAGARHATHTFNAMRPLERRDPGILGEVLTNPVLSADIIADGIHLDPAIVKLFLAAKGDAGSVLITDATSATGMPDGSYRLGNLEVELKQGRCMAGDKLAGSVLTMDAAVRNVMRFAGWSLPQAVAAATSNAARVLKLEQSGRLTEGLAADLAVLNPKGEVKATMVNGVLNAN